MIGTWRQRQAREGYWDTAGATGSFNQQAFDDAVEIATTVKISNDVIEAFEKAADRAVGSDSLAGLVAAFKAAGFEVVQ